MIQRKPLLRDQDGSVLIEFALIGPALIAMLFAVLQFGIGMQNYNSMRSASAEVARYAVVNYQTANKLTDEQITNYATSVSTAAPYNLIPERFDVKISDATTQRVTGATEKTITMNYMVPTILSFFGMQDIPLTYTRPIFLVQGT